MNIASREESDSLSTMSCLSSRAAIFMRSRAFCFLNYFWEEWGITRSLHTDVKILNSCYLLHEKLQHLYLFESPGRTSLFWLKEDAAEPGMLHEAICNNDF